MDFKHKTKRKVQIFWLKTMKALGTSEKLNRNDVIKKEIKGFVDLLMTGYTPDEITRILKTTVQNIKSLKEKEIFDLEHKLKTAKDDNDKLIDKFPNI